jgi:hypothetical protein
MPLSKVQKTLLLKLSDVLIPVTGWLKDKKHQPTSSPWRPVGKPSINDLGIVAFIESLLNDDGEQRDRKLARRWRRIERDPLKFQETLPDRKKWRRKRHDVDGRRTLQDQAIFGVTESANFILAEERIDDGELRREPLSRGEFYEHCLGAVEQIVKARGLLKSEHPLATWQAFVDDLKKPEALTGWPAEGPTSIEFLIQLQRDIVRAGWSFQQPVEAKFRDAFAIEAGEGRRPGNAYSTVDVAKSVTALEQQLGLSAL